VGCSAVAAGSDWNPQAFATPQIQQLNRATNISSLADSVYG
jgi:hypothetical protein